MNDTIVIDFGTSRTKAAYYNAESKPTLIRLGEKEFLPSIFYVTEDDEILYGDTAQSVLENQKVGRNKRTAPIRGLKLKLRSSHRRWGKVYRSVDLLTPLFTHVRDRAANIHGFDKTPPTEVILTTTKAYFPADRKVLESAADKAGFEKVTLITEPEAVAAGWVTATGPDRSDVIVLDCGGGTTDWTYLHRENGSFRMVPELRGGHTNVGGHNVDELLAKRVLPTSSGDPRLLDKVSRIKEMFCNEIPESEWPSIPIGQHPRKLESKQIEQAIREAFIDPVCKEIKPFIQEVKEEIGKGEPAILLVGGSSKLHGLKETLEREFECEVNPDWPDAEFAPVLGAVPIPASATTQTNHDPVEKLDIELAAQFDAIALLIGEPQTVESKFTVGEEKHTVVPGLVIAPTHERKLRDRAAELRKGSLRLAVLGDFSAGKSTLINAMLGQELLPTEGGACTCVPVEIVHGADTDNVTLVEVGGKQRTISLETFQEMSQFTPEEQQQFDSDPIRPERLEAVQFARLESESALCKAGIRFVDTLGANADPLSDAITKKFLDEVDTLLVVSREPIIPESTRDVIQAFAESKQDGRGYEHVFFVRNYFKDEYEKYEKPERTAERKKTDEALLYNHLKGIFKVDESLYEKRVFTVNAKAALVARTYSEAQADLGGSGLPGLESELLKFMRSIDRVSVVMRTVFITDLVPALDAAQRHISGKRASFHQNVKDMEESQHRTEAGLTELRALVERCKDTAREVTANIQGDIVKTYQREIERKFADSDFEEYWKSNKMGDILFKGQRTAEQQMEQKVRSYLRDRFIEVREEVNREISLTQEIKDALEPIIQSFFTTLHEIEPYKTEEKGLLDDAQTLEIKIADTFVPPFDLPSVSLTEPVWQNRGFLWKTGTVITGGILAGGQGIVNQINRGSTKKAILAELEKTRKSLSNEGTVVEDIKKSIDQDVSDIVDTVKTRLNAQIEVVEQQLEDAIDEAKDNERSEERLQKIDRILTAKYEEIGQAVYGRILKPEELQAAVDQTRKLKGVLNDEQVSGSGRKIGCPV